MASNTQVPFFESLPPGNVLPTMLETERSVIQALLTAGNSDLSPDERLGARLWVLDSIEKAKLETNRYAYRSYLQLKDRLVEAENPELMSCFEKLARRIQELIGDDQKMSLEAPTEIQQFWMNEAQQGRINGLALRLALVNVYDLVTAVTTPRGNYADVRLETSTDWLAYQLRKPSTNEPDRRDVLNGLSGMTAKWLELLQVLAAKGRLENLSQLMLSANFDDNPGSVERFKSYLHRYVQLVTVLNTVFMAHSDTIINALLREADAAGVDDHEEERT